MLSARSLQKRECALEVARELLDGQDVDLVLLMGSVARGIESHDSDVDLALFTECNPQPFINTRRVRGTLVEVNIYHTHRVAKGPKTPLLSLQDLREAGRFSTAEVLFTRWDHLNKAQTAWLKALLHPDEVASLFALAAMYLDSARLKSCSCVADRLWMLQGAATALATLSLSLYPFRFQKPKWLVHDMKEAKLPELLDQIRVLYLVRRWDSENAEFKLRVIEKHLVAGLKLGGLPPLTLTDDHMEDRYFYMYRTFCDAVSLCNDGDFEGSAYTALYALRLLNAMLQDSSTLPRPVKQEDVDEWRRDAIDSLSTADELAEKTLEQARGELLEYGRKLERKYKRRFITGQPFEVFPEGSWRSHNQTKANTKLSRQP